MDLNNVEYIVCVPSSLAPPIGNIPLDQRLEQSLVGIESIRNKFPNVFIIMADCSTLPADLQREIVRQKVDLFIDHSNVEINRQLSETGLKSHSELIMFSSMFNWIKENKHLFPNVKRVFKVGGRMKVSDEFDIKEYEGDNVKGKYVFKTPLESWIHPEMRQYENRLWSLDISLLEENIALMPAMYQSLDGQFDIEHTYYKHIDRNKVEHFENIWVEGVVALYGTFSRQ